MFNSERLRKLRKDLNFTQVQMNKRLNVEQSAYCKYENNKSDINVDLLRRIQEEFGIEPSEFINTNIKNVQFETGSTNNTNGIVQTEKYYSFPKEILDTIISNQQSILSLMLSIVKQH